MKEGKNFSLDEVIYEIDAWRRKLMKSIGRNWYVSFNFLGRNQYVSFNFMGRNQYVKFKFLGRNRYVISALNMDAASPLS